MSRSCTSTDSGPTEQAPATRGSQRLVLASWLDGWLLSRGGGLMNTSVNPATSADPPLLPKTARNICIIRVHRQETRAQSSPLA